MSKRVRSRSNNAPGGLEFSLRSLLIRINGRQLKESALALAMCFVGLQLSYLTWGIIQVVTSCRRPRVTDRPPWVLCLPRAGADDEAALPSGAPWSNFSSPLLSLGGVPGTTLRHHFPVIMSHPLLPRPPASPVCFDCFLSAWRLSTFLFF